MKKIIYLIITLLLLFSVSVTAEDNKNFTFGYSEDLTVCTQDDIPSENGMIFGAKEEDFKKYMKENSIILYAVDNNNSFVISVTCDQTQFTKDLISLSSLSDDDLSGVAKELVEGECTIAKTHDTVYIVKEGTEKGLENYFTRQYITVENGNLYVINFTFPNDSVVDINRIDSIVSGISYSEKAETNVFLIVVIAVVILALVVFMAIVTVTVIKDLKIKKETAEENSN